jgi:hypothetical protein
LREAVELGAPLSTKETTLLLGVRPGSDPLGRGGIEARRLGRNLWQLRKAEAVAKRKGLWLAGAVEVNLPRGRWDWLVRGPGAGAG